jgi:tRNA (guanine-N7-)-methyltransferase
MGRRALRKIDPALDFSSWLLEEESLPAHLPDASLFPRLAPLEIEVGSGKGLFLLRATATCPQHDFLGIEVAHKYARYAAAGLARHNRPNGKLVHGDATSIFAQRVLSDAVTAVHVYFPDPWWKKRHRKRRVMQESFLDDVQRVLRPGGILHFWTDVQEYFESTLELMRRYTALQGPDLPLEEMAEHDLDYRTHFERRMRLHELPVYRAQFRKR